MMKHAFLVLLVTVLSITTQAQEDVDTRAEYIRSHYSKFEYRIPMRDGKKLFTAVYIPNDRTKTYPILMLRTPYCIAPYGADQYRNWLGPDEKFEKDMEVLRNIK